MDEDDDILDSVAIVLEGDDDESDDYYYVPIPGVIFLVMVGAAILCAMIFYISKRQERRVERKKKEAKARRGKALTKCLQPKPWNTSIINSITEGDAMLVFMGSYNTAGTYEERSLGIDNARDVTVVDQCRICEHQYTKGCMVYVSNNPRCGHVFHKGCVETWLNTEYRCPVCQEVYALQDASKRQQASSKTFKPAVPETLSEDTNNNSKTTATFMEMTAKLPDTNDPSIFDV